ncbi:MAG: chorismate pyruvate-lyase family protein [Acidimicrobiia bacterium]|nr:chorismate pyruvate-lyase family protein [Acidimicrobiia bacterium]
MAAFDPADGLFIAQFERPVAIEPVNLRTLSPMHRALLVIDGTVTKFLEAYCMEPIEVTTLGQSNQTLVDPQEWLDVRAGTEVLARHVTLTGGQSGRLYAYAISLTNPTAIPRDIRAAMEIQGGSVGRILLSSRVEQRREVLWYGREDASGLPDEVRGVYDGDVVSRAYRIIVGGRPVIMIIEKFPLDVGSGPDHE